MILTMAGTWLIFEIGGSGFDLIYLQAREGTGVYGRKMFLCFGWWRNFVAKSLGMCWRFVEGGAACLG